jgi:hypothetical protein
MSENPGFTLPVTIPRMLHTGRPVTMAPENFYLAPEFSNWIRGFLSPYLHKKTGS